MLAINEMRRSFGEVIRPPSESLFSSYLSPPAPTRQGSLLTMYNREIACTAPFKSRKRDR